MISNMKKTEHLIKDLNNEVMEGWKNTNSLKSLQSLLVTSSLSLYEESPPFNFSQTTVYSSAEKRSNEEGVRRVLARLKKELEPWQTSPISIISQQETEALEAIITSHLVEIDHGRYLFDEPFLEFFLNKGYLDSARDFFMMAQKKDSNLTLEEVFQAIRNVWIMNSLQLIWNLPVEITPSVYAYSMLYPYTDNFLDDPEVSHSDKNQFNQKLSDLIQGIPQTSKNFHQQRVFKLISDVENQYPRSHFPMVYEGLGLIQDAQILSLRQNQSGSLAKEELIKLSFYKGGASVLGDACLVKGFLTPQEITFAFHYGTFLQLVDDLQDIKEDRREGHQTVFTLTAPNQTLDKDLVALFSYINTVSSPHPWDSSTTQYMKKIIGSCSLLMIMTTLGKEPQLISPSLFQKIEAISKVHLDFYPWIEKEFQSLTSDIDLDLSIKDYGKKLT